MATRLKLLPRYLINMGFLKGLYVFLQVELLSLARFRVPGYAHPIFLRAHTSDRNVFREIFLFRLYAFPLPNEPQIIVDAGANIGLSSIYFANRFKNANIYAVEPEGSNLEVLKRNATGYPQIKIVESALWYTDTFLKIKNLKEHKWAFSVEECNAGEYGSVSGISVLSLLKDNSIDKIDLLKLDIEGSERELFQFGTDDWLPKIKTLVIELHDWMKPNCSASFFSAIAKYQISVTVHEGMLVVKNNAVI